ncbi:hypothetical protein HK096_000769, partial [Nowakowskiella sp. JEL0078]
MVATKALLLVVATFAASAMAQTCVSQYGQCGGQYYTYDKKYFLIIFGSTLCCSGSTCVFSNQWYSQCLAGSAASSTTTTTTTTTTTKVPTTTTMSKVPTTTTTTTKVSSTTKVSTTTTTTTTPTGSSTGAYTAPAGSFTSSGNPYKGVLHYVSAAYAMKVDSSIAGFSSNATHVAKFNTLKKYPTFTWLDTMSAITTLQSHLNTANLPGHDCAALASNSEIPAGGIATYKLQYIDLIITIFQNKPSNIHLVLVIKPDSLPNLATNIGSLCCNSVTQSEYPSGVAYTIVKLSVISNTYLYIDASHSGCLRWPDNQAKIVPIFQNALTLAKAINSAATIHGFAASTANYSPFKGLGSCPVLR